MTDLRAQLQTTLGDGYILEREFGGGGMATARSTLGAVIAARRSADEPQTGNA